MFFSKNVNHNRGKEIGQALGITVASDLGKYLGVPLHHRRKSKQSYQFIIDKISQRLTAWKAKSLSLAGRLTLVKTVISTMPHYCMQTDKLPASVCKEIECLSRSFVWADSDDRKGNHLVAWEQLCQPKAQGGVGL